MIFEETYDLLKTKYSSLLESLTIADLRIGVQLTGVILSDGSAGTAATLTDELPVCSKSNRDFGDFTPLHFRGKPVIEFLETDKRSAGISSVKTAVMNAISSGIISSGSYRIIDDCDPYDLLDLSPVKTVTIIGAFQSYIRKIAQTGNRLYVLELKSSALAPEQKQFYIPAEDFKKVLPFSDVVIITGQTLVNSTLDELLDSVPAASQVIVTGPSSGIIPEILFAKKVKIIGMSRITDPGIMMDVVSEGGTGYHLFEYCARKICILK